MHHRCRCSGRLPSFFDLDTLSRQAPYRLLCFSADRWVTWLLKALASSWTCRHPFRTACPSWFWRWGNMALDCFRRVQGKSAYTALFDGTTKSPHHGSIWKCWAPLNAEILPGLLLLTDVGLLNFACDIVWLTRRGHLRSLRSGNGVDLTSVDTMLFFTADLARYPFKFKYTSLHAKFGWRLQPMVQLCRPQPGTCKAKRRQVSHPFHPLEDLEMSRWCNFQRH
jgi:hypothetical protein